MMVLIYLKIHPMIKLPYWDDYLSIISENTFKVAISILSIPAIVKIIPLLPKTDTIQNIIFKLENYIIGMILLSIAIIMIKFLSPKHISKYKTLENFYTNYFCNLTSKEKITIFNELQIKKIFLKNDFNAIEEKNISNQYFNIKNDSLKYLRILILFIIILSISIISVTYLHNIYDLFYDWIQRVYLKALQVS